MSISHLINLNQNSNLNIESIIIQGNALLNGNLQVNGDYIINNDNLGDIQCNDIKFNGNNQSLLNQYYNLIYLPFTAQTQFSQIPLTIIFFRIGKLIYMFIEAFTVSNTSNNTFAVEFGYNGNGSFPSYLLPDYVSTNGVYPFGNCFPLYSNNVAYPCYLLLQPSINGNFAIFSQNKVFFPQNQNIYSNINICVSYYAAN